MFRLSFKMPLNWPKWNSQHVSNLTDHESSVFVDQFLHSLHIYICFSHWHTSRVFSMFNRGHTTSELGKQLNNLCSLACSLKDTFNILEVFVAFFPSLSKISCTYVDVWHLLFSRYANIVNGPTYTCTLHGSTQQPHVLHPYFNKKISQQTLSVYNQL
jgi:hypothetical protein